MSKHEKRVVASKPEILDLIPRPVFLPDEDPLAYDALQGAMMRELSPGTTYETVLATDLVILEWEAIRHRRMRANLINAGFIDVVSDRLDQPRFKHSEPSENAFETARALAGDDEALRSRAEEQLRERGWSVSEFVARGYEKALAAIEAHESREVEIENRRRRLREEFDRLKALRKRQCDAATVIDA